MHLRIAIITIGVSRYSLPSPLGEGLGVRLLRGISLFTPLPLGEGRGGGAACCVVVWLFGCFAFSVCKVNHDFFKNQHFSGYTSSKFCKDARNQLSHRKIAKVDYAREGESPYLTLPPQQQDRETQRLTMWQKKIAITKS